jgi:hypothetical protein
MRRKSYLKGGPIGRIGIIGTDDANDPYATSRSPVDNWFFTALGSLTLGEIRRRRKIEQAEAIAALFSIWRDRHGATPVKARDLCPEARTIIDPQGRGRQFVAAYLKSLSAKKRGEYVLTRQKPSRKWGAATYALQKDGEAGP